MASPITVSDFELTKTVIACAQKRGLENWQQFIDDPEKLERLVNFVNAGAPEWQEKIVPDIDWALTCQKLGLSAEYEEFAKNNWSDPKLWIIPPFLCDISCNLVVSKMREDGVNFWLYYNDIDANLKLQESIDTPIGFLRKIEADEEKDKSAEMIWAENKIGITLPKRLVLGAGYFWTTGGHLDVKCITLCAGSCWQSGSIPCVYFGPGGDGVYLGRCNPDYHDLDLRSRLAVPLPVAKQLA